MKKRIKFVTITILSIVVLWFFIANSLIESNASGKLFDRAADCPNVRVALVLGTSKTNKKGNENLYFNYRIQAAVSLYNSGKVKYILVSGDNSTPSYDEPTAMKNALIANGIPAQHIYLDYAGFRTLDSMERTRKVFGQKEVIVVSQRFHNERAIYLGEHFGMTVYGLNAKDVQKNFGIKTKIRERFARMKVFWDLLFGVQSKFLGEPEHIG